MHHTLEHTHESEENTRATHVQQRPQDMRTHTCGRTQADTRTRAQERRTHTYTHADTHTCSTAVRLFAGRLVAAWTPTIGTAYAFA